MAIDGAGGGAVVAANDDMADEMQCNDHPYRKNSPGGICALCLQEKLGKLVSSSSSSFVRPSTSSSSPSFRSDQFPTIRLTPYTIAASSSTAAPAPAPMSLSLSSASNRDVSNGGGGGGYHRHHHHEGKNGRRARLPFLLSQKKTNKKPMNMIASFSSSTTTTTTNSGDNVVLKRSKSTATPRSGRFWSFFHSSHKNPSKSTEPPAETSRVEQAPAPAAVVVVVDETDSSPNSCGSNATSFGRKVSRSRSVGCGSRSFSGDFFERISTGFGDCTLRRVESQREGRRSTSAARAGAGGGIRDRVPCGGLFGGFVITSSSSSSSWVSSAEDGSGPGPRPGAGPIVNGRNRNWAWAFASPRRAFAKSSTTTTTIIKENGKKDNSNAITNTSSGAPNLAAIQSLLAVRGAQ